VLQDSVLFEGTIRENIEIGRPGAPLEDTIEAAKKANIHEMIANLPDGYDTLVREQGNNFSAGQRQRLAIARAILRDTPILILDEPTANLDVEAEAEVMHALNTLISGRTVLTISHRLSTLGSVDEILVMHNGQIVEQGSFRKLKQKKGLFAKLIEEQNRYNLDRTDDEAVIRPALAPLVANSEQLTMATVPFLPAVSATTIVAHKGNGSSPDHNGRILTPTLPAGSNFPLKDEADDDDDTLKAPILTVQSCYQDARVLLEIDEKPVREYRLNKAMFTIGRYPTSDIQISSQRVSRFHAIIHWSNGAWIIEDVESLNGLTCQGQRIDKLALVSGDRIYIDPAIVLQYKELEHLS